MQFLHDRKYLDAGDVVEVDCDTQCNVTIMDDSNFQRYRTRAGHDYYGGWREDFSTQITVPSTGYWNVVIDLAGGSGSIRHSITYLR